MKYGQRSNVDLQQHTIPAESWPTQGRRTTLGDVRRSGMYVEYICANCLNIRSFDPRVLPFGNLQLVTVMHRRMRCTFCGGAGASSVTRPTSVGPRILTSRQGGGAP
jgi:hypothetical protein